MGLEHLKDGNYIGGLTMPKEKSSYWKMENGRSKNKIILDKKK